MSTLTENYGFMKPEKTDPADITAINENWEKVDEALTNHTHDLSMTNHRITDVAEPLVGSDVATRHFVEQHTIAGNTYVALDYSKDGNITIKPYVADEDELTFRDHINNKNNPHKVTLKQIGAAPAVEDTTYAGCYYRTVSGAKEWINPPMVFGTEYRTTERHNGKVVYTKLINFGTLPNKDLKEVAIGITGDKCIDIQCVIHMTGGQCSANPYISSSYAPATRVLVDSAGNLEINTNADLSTYTATVQIKYTK